MKERERDIVEDVILRHCGPLVFIASMARANEILDNGTFGLIDTGERQLLITCEHVWSHLETLRRTYPEAEAAINLGPGYTMVISDAQVVSVDRDLDIAVLDPKLAPRELGNLSYFRIESWPIRPMVANDVIAFAGYPQCQVEVTETCGNFGSGFFGFHVSTANERKALLMNDGFRRTFVGRFGERLPARKTSGISGCPAYRLGEHGLEFAGIVREGSTTDGWFVLSQGSLLNPDGTLKQV